MKPNNKALAIHLISNSNISEMSKENVMTKVDLNNDEAIYTTMLKAMREVKVMTENMEGNKTNEKDIVKDVSKTFYGYEAYRRNRSNSRSGNNYFRK